MIKRLVLADLSLRNKARTPGFFEMTVRENGSIHGMALRVEEFWRKEISNTVHNMFGINVFVLILLHDSPFLIL